ncbi:MAG: response regulator transcription factor [Oscillospiraceae bacterium]|nr:response regulator transcription factor [Oscillospiraceae bacterium]
MKKILIVEDDSTLSAGLSRALKNEETETTSAENIHTAREVLAKGGVSLVILDVNLPDGSGFDFLPYIKKEYGIPVIMLTANDLETDIVAGLEAGADDYITKPFSLAVLRARVNTQLRKAIVTKASDCFVSDNYIFDFERMEFSVDGVSVELSKTEQKLLRILTDNAGITLSRDKLVDRIWTDGSEYVDENALSVTVKRLRDKLNAKDSIKTVYGIGYMWVKNDEK